MPAHRSKKRWDHSRYKFAFIIERYGNCYARIKGAPPISMGGLKFKPENRNEAIRLLTKLIQEKENPSATNPKTLYDAIEEYGSIHFQRMRELQISRYLNTFKQYLPEDHSLDDIHNIRKMINDQIGKYNHAPNTLRKKMQQLERLFKFCVEQDYMDKNPIVSAMKPEEIPPNKKIFTLEELEQIYEYFNSLGDLTYHLKSKKVTRARNQYEDKREYVLFLKFIAHAATRGAETLKIYWDDIKNDKIIIDGKRSNYNVPKIREISLDLVPHIIPILEELKQFRDANNGKLFKWTSLTRPRLWLHEAMQALKIDDNRAFHAIRNHAINWWEKGLGIPVKVCEYMAGHTERTRDKYYNVYPTSEELVQMVKLSSPEIFDYLSSKKVSIKFQSDEINNKKILKNAHLIFKNN